VWPDISKTRERVYASLSAYVTYKFSGEGGLRVLSSRNWLNSFYELKREGKARVEPLA